MHRNVRSSVRLALVFGVVAAFAGLIPLPAPVEAGIAPPPPPPPPPLDHFKCYQTSGPPLGVSVGLKDQFDPTFVGATVLGVRRFCNPVRKTHAGGTIPILNPDAHLKLYAIATTTQVPSRTVVVRNQFGSNQTLTVGPPVVLAVPTQKLPHRPPEGLDHFKCYRASGPNLQTKVRLKDQFEARSHVVGQPVLFCNPTQKVHGGVTTPILNRARHLTCYRITIRPFGANVIAVNQFGTENLFVRDADRLCVPSRKLSVTLPPPTP